MINRGDVTALYLQEGTTHDPRGSKMEDPRIVSEKTNLLQPRSQCRIGDLAVHLLLPPDLTMPLDLRGGQVLARQQASLLQLTLLKIGQKEVNLLLPSLMLLLRVDVLGVLDRIVEEIHQHHQHHRSVVENLPLRMTLEIGEVR